MNRARDYYDGTDMVTRIIAFGALIVLLIITLPGLFARVPTLANGVTCSSLSTASGNGTNQSWLAKNADPNALHLEIASISPNYTPGTPISFSVLFINDGAVPITFAFNPAEVVFRYTGLEQGLMFFIQSQTLAVLGVPASVQPPAPLRQSFPPSMLYMLAAKQRCNQVVTMSANQAAAAGVTNGQYQFTAVYRNLNAGVLQPVGGVTPTPVFPNQGAWVTTQEGVRSNIALINVGAAPAPQ